MDNNGVKEKAQRAFSQEATEVAGGGETQRRYTYSFPGPWLKIILKIRQLSFTQQTLRRTPSLCFSLCQGPRGRSVVLKMLPTWWGLRQVHKQARAPQFPGPGEGHTCNPVIAQVGSRASSSQALETPFWSLKSREARETRRLCQQAGPKEPPP